MIDYDIPKEGYIESTYILSDSVLIQFSVPCHVWNVLEQSKEWKCFQNLLEKYQKEHVQKERQAVECQQEV